jgi:hypothetical protein
MIGFIRLSFLPIVCETLPSPLYRVKRYCIKTNNDKMASMISTTVDALIILLAIIRNTILTVNAT